MKGLILNQASGYVCFPPTQAVRSTLRIYQLNFRSRADFRRNFLLTIWIQYEGPLWSNFETSMSATLTKFITGNFGQEPTLRRYSPISWRASHSAFMYSRNSGLNPGAKVIPAFSTLSEFRQIWNSNLCHSDCPRTPYSLAKYDFS